MRAFATALLAGDRTAAQALALRYATETRSRADVFADLFQPAQRLVGDLWYDGTIRVADEHRATAVLQSLVPELRPTATAAPVRAGNRCLLMTVPNEKHTIGVHLLRLALQDEGWDVPAPLQQPSADDVEAAIRRYRPQVVGISAAHSSRVRLAGAMAQAAKRPRVFVIVGGEAFNRLSGAMQLGGADAYASDARIAAVLLRREVA